MRNFFEEFIGRFFFWEEFFGRNFLEGILWEEFFVYSGIDLFVKIWFLSRFCLKARRKEGRIQILRSASASISHLKS